MLILYDVYDRNYKLKIEVKEGDGIKEILINTLIKLLVVLLLKVEAEEVLPRRLEEKKDDLETEIVQFSATESEINRQRRFNYSVSSTNENISGFSVYRLSRIGKKIISP